MSARQAGCVAIGGRGVLIEGAAGVGKSALALALIDRGAVLVGDDYVMLEARDGTLWASPHPATAGLIELRNVGLLPMPTARDVPVALVIRLSADAPRYVEEAPRMLVEGISLPCLTLYPDTPVLALRVEMALAHHGL